VWGESPGSIPAMVWPGSPMLNPHLSYFASAKLLRKFGEFTCQFSLAAADRRVTGQERTELLDSLGDLSAVICHDLASVEDLRTEHKLTREADLKNPVMSKLNRVLDKTTPQHFVDACSTEGRDSVGRLFAGPDAEGLASTRRKGSW
jgi:hypothetical protein